MPELTDMMNVGKDMAKKLNEVGIDLSEVWFCADGALFDG